jgi:hypothetical protein
MKIIDILYNNNNNNNNSMGFNLSIIITRQFNLWICKIY